MIALTSVTLAHGDADRFSLDVPDLSVRAGEKIALIGPSGFGKSTVLAALAGLFPARAGTVQVAGVDLSDASDRARRRLRATLGLILQTPTLVPSLDVRANVMLPLRLRGDAIDAGVEHRVADLLARVGLAARADHLPDALSRGERQRVAICRALLPRPALILADEPTAALDAAASAQVIDLMFEWMGARGTLIMATHDPTLRDRFDRVLDLAEWSA